MRLMGDERVLVSAGCTPEVVAHCLAVARTAAGIAGRVRRIAVDRQLVRLGGLYHDIGRARSHGMDHAVVGVEIGRDLGFSDALLSIIERHIGAGIPADEAERLGLPKKDYIPLTPEEKIVSYADNLTKGEHPAAFEDAVERFRAMLGAGSEGVAMFIRQHREIQEWMR